jgi:hypothetical protein
MELLDDARTTEGDARGGGSVAPRPDDTEGRHASHDLETADGINAPALDDEAPGFIDDLESENLPDLDADQGGLDDLDGDGLPG